MGNGKSTPHGELAKARDRLVEEMGAVAVTGRYHNLPRRAEDDYDLDRNRELGQGYNGSVYTARNKTTNMVVAVKTLKLFGLSKIEMRNLRNEVELFLGMDHPHIARLMDVYEEERQLTLVMECLPGGELFDRLQREQRFSQPDAARTARMMLLAIAYLHSKEIVHRDIKMENFLYDSKEHKFLKLIDFGFSRHHKNVSKRMRLACGTAAYMAPEVLNGDYDRKCDLWSTGVVVFILLMGYMPFGSQDNQQEARIKSGQIIYKEDLWQKLSGASRSFVGALLQVDPEQRPTANEALDHTWLQTDIPVSPSNAFDERKIVRSMQAFANASKFRRACMSMMAWSLTNEERSEVRKAFLDMDKERTGAITLVQLKQVLEEHVCITDMELQRIFQSLDGDCDDEVSYSDFLSAMVASSIQMNDNLIMSAFNRFDIDHTGYITVQNLRQVLSSTSSEEEIQKIMDSLDLSRDGKISREEFQAFLVEPNEEIGEAALRIIDSEVRQRKSGSTTKSNGFGATATLGGTGLLSATGPLPNLVGQQHSNGGHSSNGNDPHHNNHHPPTLSLPPDGNAPIARPSSTKRVVIVENGSTEPPPEGTTESDWAVGKKKKGGSGRSTACTVS